MQSILLEVQYLAPVQYFTKLVKYESVLLEQHENYSKGSFRNRCYIATANRVLALSIPLLKGKNQQSPIRSVEIDNRQPWQKMHWRSIRTAYGNAPYFEYYADPLNVLYSKKYNLLFDFCTDLQAEVLNLLNISAAIQYSDQFYLQAPEGVLDFRNKIKPKNYQTPQDDQFVPQTYPQVFEDRHGFISNLSILDLLFCTGPEAFSYLQSSLL